MKGDEKGVPCDDERDSLEEEMAQWDSYPSGLRLDGGWLVILNRGSGLPPIGERTVCTEDTTLRGRRFTVIQG